MEKKIDRQLHKNAVSNIEQDKSWRQHPTKQQQYSHLPPILKIIKIRWNRHAGEVGMSSQVMMYSCGPLHMDVQRQDDQLEPTYSRKQ